MTKLLVRLTYQKFAYFLMFLLFLTIVFNGFSTINNWIAIPLVLLMVLIELVLVVVVEFNEGPETLWTKFLSRFTKVDVLVVCVLIIVYIGSCNGWLDIV